MLSIYYELDEDLKRIRRYLSGQGEDQTLDQRRFAYIACVSALYATFERFTERAVYHFAQLLFDGPNHLTEIQLNALRKRYVSNSSHMLSLSLGSGRYRSLTHSDVATSLASCLDETSDYKLLLEVVAHHNANLRWESISDLFRWAVPDMLQAVCRADAISNWRTPVPNGVRALSDVLDGELADLVERRNSMAHSGIPDDILSHDDLRDKVEFIDAIALGMISCLGAELFETTKVRGESDLVGSPSRRYKGGRVVVLSVATDIRIGSSVWVRRGSKTRWGSVVQIRIDDSPVGSASAGIEASIETDFVVPNGAEIFVWRTPDGDLSAPPSSLFGDQGPS